MWYNIPGAFPEGPREAERREKYENRPRNGAEGRMMIIMSNNLWNCDRNKDAWAAKGEDCSADARVDGLVRAYTSVMPDILGFEEMSRHMEMLIMQRMRRIPADNGETAKYEIVTGGFTPILFRHDRLLLLESGHMLYPREFPPYEGSFNDADSKGYTFGVFEERKSGSRVIVITTHLWWRSDSPAAKSYQKGSGEARAYQIGLATQKAEELMGRWHCPAILMGDLNDMLGSKCLNAALAAGWQETHALCTGERNDTRGYHYCFADGWRHDPPGEYERAIDHILIKAPGRAEVRRFCRYMEASFEPLSDHFPVYIELAL